MAIQWKRYRCPFCDRMRHRRYLGTMSCRRRCFRKLQAAVEPHPTRSDPLLTTLAVRVTHPSGAVTVHDESPDSPVSALLRGDADAVTIQRGPDRFLPGAFLYEVAEPEKGWPYPGFPSVSEANRQRGTDRGYHLIESPEQG